MKINHIYCGDALKVLTTLPDNSVDCGVTSPPYYGLRDYGVSGQLGLEASPEIFIANMVSVFREFRRVLKPEGTLWINIGDSYVGTGGDRKNPVDNEIFNHQQQSNPKSGRYQRTKYMKENLLKPKDLIGIPWMLAFALRADGWYLRQDIIWSKPNPMPESVKDRCTKSHEYIFLLSKSASYYYDAEAIKEPSIGTHSTIHRTGRTRYGGNKYTANPEQFYRTKSGNAYEPREKRNKRSVWTVATKGFKEAHFATFSEELITPCILAGCPQGGIVLDMFFGSGTTGIVAIRNFRNYIGIELNQKYIEIAERRLGPYNSQINIFDYKVEQ